MRALWIAAAGVLVAGIAVGSTCAWGPIWAPEIRGRVTDARTGEGVEGAEVFAVYYQGAIGTYPHPVHARWATTDGNGRYVIPGEVVVEVRLLGFTEDLPRFVVVHPEYGRFGRSFIPSHPEITGELFPGWDQVDFRISPNPRTLESLNERGWQMHLCTALTDPACARAEEVMYPDGNPPELRSSSPIGPMPRPPAQ